MEWKRMATFKASYLKQYTRPGEKTALCEAMYPHHPSSPVITDSARLVLSWKHTHRHTHTHIEQFELFTTSTVSLSPLSQTNWPDGSCLKTPLRHLKTDGETHLDRSAGK